ncbi:MAG: transcriptional repressor [Clostridia bacterium]|nr:transcriptional repressor [Clostridia bacterium]
MERKHYQTPGRVALTDFLELHPDRQYTADELYAAVRERAEVGKSTVYRLLAELCRDEVVRKFRSETRQSNVYQYIGTTCDCRDHFHEKCVKCGAVYHLDCHATSEFIHHLFAEHGFWVDCGQTILYGVCSICRGEV